MPYAGSGEPHRPSGERHCERRQRNQVFLVDVLELLRIARVQRADTDAERIEHRVPPCVGLPHRSKVVLISLS
jgi:hypothetical protein